MKCSHLFSSGLSHKRVQSVMCAQPGQEKAVDSTYENYTTAAILEPLGMSSSGFYLTGDLMSHLVSELANICILCVFVCICAQLGMSSSGFYLTGDLMSHLVSDSIKICAYGVYL